ncbi:sulfatase [Halomarina rubra]|uniref:Sulfatase n=1 Tax=Halomarina rubra TaxID=2071873 RepID=A0ABD6AU65_9EURY|nr:sulfatase [Halomarina rubra]
MRDVLFITVDSLRADHVGCYGYDRPTTPNVDDLAGEGHTFENAFSHACATRPSFPSILTSSTALMYGGYERISERRTLVSEALKPEFSTAGFHSNLYLSEEFGYGRGFDEFFDSKTDPSGLARLKQEVKERLDEDGRLFQFLSRAVETAEKEAGVNVGSAYVRADEMTDMGIEWAERQRDGPRFLWVHYMDVHHPYVPPAEHQRPFRDDPVGERESIKLRRKMIEDPGEVTDEELDTIIDLYDAEIRYTDAEVGRLVERVRAAWDDPVVCFTSDHGEEFREHGGFSHSQTFHDEVTHVPLVVDVGDDAGATHEDIVGMLDVTPTLVDYAGQEQSEAFYGHSLRALVEDDEWPREHVVGDWADGERTEFRYAYRDDRWKFVDLAGETALYDLEADPEERTDVSGEFSDERERIEAVLDDHRDTVAATAEDLDEVEMTEDVKSRLRDLGYAE